MRTLSRRPASLLLVLALAGFLLPAIGPAARAQSQDQAQAPEGSGSPRRLNDWRLRCATDRDEIIDSLAPAQGTRMFADLDHAGSTCRILAGSGGPCAMARAELLATLLNVGAGRLPATICVQAGDEVRALSRLINSADSWLFQGCTSEKCERISAGLRGVNDGTRLVACGGATQAEPVPGAPEPEPQSPPRAAPVDDPAPSQESPIIQPVLAAPPAPDAGPEASLPPEGTCCDPRDARAWQRACTLSGKWTTLTTLLDNDNLRDFGMSTCAALALPDIDPQEESRRQLVALRLNVRSGFLAPTCPLVGGETVEQAGRRAFRARRDARPVEARDIALALNEGTSLIARMPCAKPPEGQDLIWEPPPPVVEAAEPDQAPAPAPAPSSKRRKR